MNVLTKLLTRRGQSKHSRRKSSIILTLREYKSFKFYKRALIRELDIMRTMNHPSIIKLHEVFENDGHIYLVCDYLEGGELFSYLKSKGVYNERNAVTVIRKLLQALEYIHTKGIIHRDIKVKLF